MPRPSFVWDYELDDQAFRAMLAGHRTEGRLDRNWAAVRLLEYATYREILQYLSFAEIVEGWPEWREKIRSESRRRGFDFLVSWLPQHHPELLERPLGDRGARG